MRILEIKHQESGGHCGVKLNDFGIDDLKSIKSIINQLYKEKVITVHEGAQGKLIKLNKPKHANFEKVVDKNKSSMPQHK
ncbi:hypothetical protein [Galbibacter sp. BG1]